MRERRQPRNPRIVRAGQPVAKPAPRVEQPAKKTAAKKTTRKAAKKTTASLEPVEDPIEDEDITEVTSVSPPDTGASEVPAVEGAES